VLFVRSAVPLDWQPEWWRPHTHVTALTPLRSGRAIIGGTFTHPAPVAGFVYTGSAGPLPLTRLAEQRDGQSLFGRPLADLDAATFSRLARRLGIGSVVALEEDVGRSGFLTENQSVMRMSRIGPFNLFAIPGAAAEPAPLDLQRWEVAVPSAGPGWRSLPIAYSPLWIARGAGQALDTRPGEDGLLEVALAAPLTSVELEHRPGAAEWAGLALSLATLLALSAWGVRMRRA
jgi:hypothetical protein